MKKKHLEMILDNLKPHPKPKSYLEQYTIEGKLASELLFFAMEDIKDNFVIDLGCGTGRLSIGAKLIGANRVLGIDIDNETIESAKNNLEKLKEIPTVFNLNLDPNNIIKEVCFICKDVKYIDKNCIDNYINSNNKNIKRIVIQNPPFGSQKKYADRIFLDRSLEIGDIVYTIHNSSTRDFIINYISKKNRRISNIFESRFRIPKIYNFHSKRYIEIPVDIYRIV
ncbi:METTL5 family protein [Methanothermococcus sp. SCGC AD-155-M21]|nr:METTL5 family protein [Methanothermococcus sp. SCGC AD-155-M21]